MENSSSKTVILQTERKLKPIVKWVGGKGQLIGEIVQRLPIGFGNEIKRYAEPFVGGGALLFYILGNFELSDVYISDTNAELVNMYRKIKSDVHGVISQLSDLQGRYWFSDENGKKALFYEKRNRFNELIKSGVSGDSVEAAALFIFINRTCFNGLYRVNRGGLYNAPMGRYSKPLICDIDNLLAVSDALQYVTIECADYRKSYDFIDGDTFAYFDPPYRPLTKTAEFTSYTENEFNDDSQRELAEYVTRLKEKGAYVMVSNSDPKNSNPDDNFFDDLYGQFDISRVKASRAINSNGEGRGKISELLIRSY